MLDVLVEFGAVVVLTGALQKQKGRWENYAEGGDGLQVDACAGDRRESKERRLYLKKSELKDSWKWQIQCLSPGEPAIKAAKMFSFTAAITSTLGKVAKNSTCIWRFILHSPTEVSGHQLLPSAEDFASLKKRQKAEKKNTI